MTKSENEKTEAIEYTLTPVEGSKGMVKGTLSYVHQQYLMFLSTRGGEADFNYEPLKEEQRTHIKALATMRCIEETPIVGTNGHRFRHRLSDLGRNVVTRIKETGLQSWELERKEIEL